MAGGRPIGVAYVELDLDASRYLKGQQQLLKDATSTSLNIEKNFQNLGIKSSAIFDLTRQKIQNSYEMILNSSKATANDIVRAEEAKNVKLKALNDQQYGAHASFIDSIKKNWMAASAAIVAAWMLVNRAVALMDEGAKALAVESAFKIMSDSAGVNSERLIESMKAATKETIDDSDMMQKAIKLMTLAYDPTQIERFSRVVITASQIAGITAAQAYDELADAIANRMPKALIRMGAVTKEQMKIVNEAIEAGAPSIMLYELAMTNLELKQKMLQGTQNQATIALQRFHAEVKGTWESIGKGLIWAVQELYGGFQLLAAGALFAAYGIIKLVQWSAELAGWTADKLGFTEKAAAMKAFATTVETEARALKMAGEELATRAVANIIGTTEISSKATKQELANAKARIDAQMAELAKYKETTEAAKKAAQEKEAATKRILEAIRKANIEIDAEGKTNYEKEIIRINSEVEEYRKSGIEKIYIAQFVESATAIVKMKKEEEFRKYQQKSGEDYLLFLEKQADEHDTAIRERYLEDKKYADDLKKLGEKSTEDFLIAQEKEREEHDTTIRERYFAEKKLSIERIKLEADIYKDIRGYDEEYYEAQKQLIANRVKDLRTAGVSEIAIKAWVDEEDRRMTEKKILRSKDFFAGMKVQMDQNSRDQKAWGQVGADVFGKFATDAQRQLSDNLFNVLTGKFDQLSLDWNSLWEGMLRTLSDKIAQMAVEAASAEVFKLLGPAWDWIGTIFAAKGIWEIEGPGRGIPVIAHPGEMIIPASIAEQIRMAGGGDAFTALQSMIAMMGEIPGGEIPGLAAFFAGTAKEQGKLMGIGALMTLTGKITPGQFAEGITSPQALVSSILKGGIPAIVSEIFGLDKPGSETKLGPSARAFAVASGIASLFGAPLVMSTLVGIAAQFLGRPIARALYDLGIIPYDWLYYAPYEPGPFTNPYATYDWETMPSPYSEAVEAAAEAAAAAAAVGDWTGGWTAEGEAAAEAAASAAGDAAADAGYGYDGAFDGGMEGGGWGGGGDDWGKGGLARRRSIFGERGPEWAVPTYEPERSRFLRDVGVDLPAMADALAKRLPGNGGGITVNFNIDGNLIADQQTFDEFVEKIDYALDKRSRRVYAS